MIVTYNPEDGTPQTWTFDPKRVRSIKAEAIERRSGENWDAWLVAVQSGSMRARRVLLWHLLSLEHTSLRWEDTPDFYSGELSVEHTSTELHEIRDKVAKAKLPADQREQVLTALDVSITEAMAREDEAEPEGKALSPNVGSATP